MRRSSLLACLSLVGSLAAIFLYVGFLPIDADGSYRWNVARTDLRALADALAFEAKERGRLPTEAEGLESLVNGEPKVLDRVPVDPWHSPYVYRRIAEAPGFEVYSAGQNGEDESGKGDDIVLRDKSYRCADYFVGCVVTARQVSPIALMLVSLVSLAVICYRTIAWGIRFGSGRGTGPCD
jgi:general secretion pathway protein G